MIPQKRLYVSPEGQLDLSLKRLCGSAEGAVDDLVDDLLKGCVVQQRVWWMIH